MSNNILIKTNVIICAVILLGFVGISAVSYHSNVTLFMRDIEHVTTLTSDGIYYRLKTVFTKHIHISLTMANDSLLKDLLSNETTRLDDPEYVLTLSEYLEAYRKAYDYDSVFLVSTTTNRYYNFSGINRVLHKDNPENTWYYQFLAERSEYSLNVDNDEAAHNEITVFVNCRITDSDGAVMGVVGVGLRVNYLQSLLHEYEAQFGVNTFLVNENGVLEIGTDRTGYQQVNHFDISGYSGLREEILTNKDEIATQAYWLDEHKAKNYLVARYIPELSWHLLIEHDTARLDAELRRQLLHNVVIVLAIIAASLLTITYVVRGYNRRIIQITEQRERERQAAFRMATEQLYDTIYEMNLTANRAAGKSTEQHFENLGIPGDATYDEALMALCEKQIKKEHREAVWSVLARENILHEYRNGNTTLRHDFMMCLDGGEYRWTRVVIHSYAWEDDGSIRMFAYFRNIDAEKRRHLQMEKQAQKDSLTNMYNKAATQRMIEQMLLAANGKMHAFFIFDIDDFKQINDRYGHAFGDVAIVTFAQILKRNFRDQDVVGRIGGDEFVAFVPVPDENWVHNKACLISAALNAEVCSDNCTCSFSSSIGVAIAPKDGTDFETLYKKADAALYATKKSGKNGFTVCDFSEV